MLACAEGLTNQQVAAREGVNQVMVGKWRRRLVTRRLDGLHDEPRPGRLRTIGDDDVERLIVKTLEETPPDATHWSTRSMAKATGMSQSGVSRIWRAFSSHRELPSEGGSAPAPPCYHSRRVPS